MKTLYRYLIISALLLAAIASYSYGSQTGMWTSPNLIDTH